MIAEPHHHKHTHTHIRMEGPELCVNKHIHTSVRRKRKLGGRKWTADVV